MPSRVVLRAVDFDQARLSEKPIPLVIERLKTGSTYMTYTRRFCINSALITSGLPIDTQVAISV